MQYGKPGRGRFLTLFIFIAVLSIALIIATVFGVSYMLDGIAAVTPSEKGGMAVPTDTSEPQTEQTEAVIFEKKIIYLERMEDDVHTGDLILVNAENEFIFSENRSLVPVYGNKPDTYKLSNAEIYLEKKALAALNEMMTGFYAKYNLGDVLLAVGYRDFDTQMQLYSARAEAEGIAAVTGYLALAGYSEHHTALAFDLSVYTDDGKSLTLADKTQYSWLTDNCHKYGFVLRYDPEKTDITGIIGEKWHFRYIGHPHAYYMKKNNLVLEEYIELLRDFTFDDPLTVSDDLGGSYEIYYVSLANGDFTKIPVCEDAEYNISGNNKNGFIVTLKL